MSTDNNNTIGFYTNEFVKTIIPTTTWNRYSVTFKYKGETTILAALLADIVNNKISFIIPTLVLIFVGITAIGTIIYRYSSNSNIKDNDFLKGVFDVSMPWLLIRILGFIFTIMVYFKIGPDWVISESTGGLILNDLILKLFTCYLEPKII